MADIDMKLVPELFAVVVKGLEDDSGTFSVQNGLNEILAHDDQVQFLGEKNSLASAGIFDSSNMR